MSSSLADLVDEFQDLETPEERIQFLIELGQSMPEFPEEFCREEFRVVGCQSMVWVVPQWDGERFQFIATSDAPMVHGLAAILVAAYSQKTPTEIVDLPIESIFEGLQLKSFLSPLRSNGLNSMIQVIRSYARDKLVVSEMRSQPTVAEPTKDGGAIANRIASIRADFPILSQTGENGSPIAYLDNAASAQRPVQVIEAIDSVYREHYASVHRSGHQWAGITTSKMEDSREAVRRFIDAQHSEEIVFTSGTTGAINLVAQSWGRHTLKKGDVILLSEMEHHSNIVPWQQLAEELGVQIQWAPIDDDFRIDGNAFRSMLKPEVKLVSFTAVSNVLGTVNPVKELVREAKSVGAKVLVDAAQTVPHGNISVRDWDADWIAFSGHKMLASTGTGILYGKRELLESMPPWIGGGNMIKLVTKEGFTVAGLPHKFEAGTPATAEAISFKPAIDYLERLGRNRIHEYELLLRERAIAGLKQIDGIELYTPSSGPSCGIVSFNLQGVHGDTVSKLLDSRGIAIRVGHHCAMPLHQRLGISASCRASFYFYNTVEEVDRFVAAVAAATSLFRK